MQQTEICDGLPENSHRYLFLFFCGLLRNYIVFLQRISTLLTATIIINLFLQTKSE